MYDIIDTLNYDCAKENDFVYFVLSWQCIFFRPVLMLDLYTSIQNYFYRIYNINRYCSKSVLQSSQYIR